MVSQVSDKWEDKKLFLLGDSMSAHKSKTLWASLLCPRTMLHGCTTDICWVVEQKRLAMSKGRGETACWVVFLAGVMGVLSLTSDWKVVAELWKMLGFLASGGEEFSPGPVMRLDHSELLYNKVLLKYKRDRQSFWHRHQKGGRKSVPLLVFSQMLYSYQQAAN